MRKILISLLILGITSLSAATLREKVAQLLIIGFHESTYFNDSTIAHHIKSNKVGGVILYNIRGSRNVKNPSQLKHLISNLKSAADYKLLVTLDQEGGQVATLDPLQGFELNNVPPVMLGQCNDPKSTFDIANSLAIKLKEIGIDVNFAPVVDININPSNFIVKKGRTFGRDPIHVAAHAQAFSSAMHNNRIHATLKHFPGHGSSSGDTHHGFVDTTNTWLPEELEPYRILINSGYNDLIMSTHCINSHLDPSGVPATFSKPILTNLLRNELNFKGVVVSDDLCMGAILGQYDFLDALKQTLNAGADMLIIANHKADYTETAINGIVSMVQNGQIPESRINEAYNRVMKLKDRF